MLQKTHTKECPWWIIKSDDKQLAWRETMKLILNSVRYRGRKRNLNFKPRADIVVPGNVELKRMKSQARQYGKPLA